MFESKIVKIILIEDEADQRKIISSILTKESYDVVAFNNAEDALKEIEKQDTDIVISDWKLPGMSGEELLSKLSSLHPDCGFIMITGHSDASHAINMIRSGADDYLPKPFDRQALLFTVSKLIYTKSLEQENKQLKQESKHRSQLVDMIGRSTKMNRLFTRIEKAAPTSATVLITGESGTGKELAARAIHQLSKRASSIFLPVNCAAIPETLAEAELFGSEKGSYTGANKTRFGKFEAADNGTIFLDEIGELPLILQSKLLRFLQEGTITRVGANKEIKLDVRVIAATNKNLVEEVKENRFREDLYYRLNVIPATIPPLRHRQEDTALLVTHFLSYFCKKHHLEVKTIASSGLKKLLAYSWPGNVRQLRNSLERLILLSADDVITLEDVDDLELQGNSNINKFLLPENGLQWEDHEKDCLTQALSLCNNNKTQAAKLLGLAYKAFLYRLEKHNL